MSKSESDTMAQVQIYDAYRRKLSAAATDYLEFAQVAPYEDLISLYVTMWLNANGNSAYDQDFIYWPHGGDASSPDIVWKKLFDGVPIDLHNKPSLSPRCWGQVREELLIFEIEIPYLARLKKWMAAFVALNSPRPKSSRYVFFPGKGIKHYRIPEARMRWKDLIEDKEGRLLRPNIVTALQRRIDDFDWFPMNCGGMVETMSQVLQEKMFQEFLDLRSPRAIKPCFE